MTPSPQVWPCTVEGETRLTRHSRVSKASVYTGKSGYGRGPSLQGCPVPRGPGRKASDTPPSSTCHGTPAPHSWRWTHPRKESENCHGPRRGDDSPWGGAQDRERAEGQ